MIAMFDIASGHAPFWLFIPSYFIGRFLIWLVEAQADYHIRKEAERKAYEDDLV